MIYSIDYNIYSTTATTFRSAYALYTSLSLLALDKVMLDDQFSRHIQHLVLVVLWLIIDTAMLRLHLQPAALILFDSAGTRGRVKMTFIGVSISLAVLC